MFKAVFSVVINSFIFLNTFTKINALDGKIGAYNEKTLDNLILDDEYFLKQLQDTTSLMECTLYCQATIKCMSFCYNSVEAVCRLHSSGFYKTSDGVSQEGWRYYLYGEQSCPMHENFVKIQSSDLCIHLSPIQSSYLDAREYCSKMNSKVISLDTWSKAAASVDVLLNESLGKHVVDDIYIGMINFDVPTPWSWENGKKSGVTQWYPGQPSCPEMDCRCTIKARSWNWRWNSTHCTEMSSFVCELEL